MAVLRLENIDFAYGKKRVLEDVNFEIDNGVVALLGPNGAGKTTLIKVIMGLMRPSCGNVIFNDKNIEKLGTGYYDYVGYMPQMPHFYSDFKAYNFLVYMAALKGISKKEAKERAARLLKDVDLYQYKDMKIGKFSGGMKQRLGIAQALLNDPSIVILDEPTAGLDPNERIRFRNIITDIAASRIVMLATHIISDVESIAKRILFLKEGKLIQCDSPRQFVSELNGNVYSIVVDKAEVKNISSKYKVSNIRELDDEKYELRVVSKETLEEAFIQVEPNLEDAFLLYF